MMYVNLIIFVVIVSEKKIVLSLVQYTHFDQFLSSIYEVLQVYLKVR
jgi:hypothetical protein